MAGMSPADGEGRAKSENDFSRGYIAGGRKMPARSVSSMEDAVASRAGIVPIRRAVLRRGALMRRRVAFQPLDGRQVKVPLDRTGR